MSRRTCFDMYFWFEMCHCQLVAQVEHVAAMCLPRALLRMLRFFLRVREESQRISGYSLQSTAKRPEGGKRGGIMQQCIDADDFVDVAWCERAHVTVLRLILTLLLTTHSASVSHVSTAAPLTECPSAPAPLRALHLPPPPGQQL